MEKNSLIILRDKIIEAIDKIDNIPQIDKVEAMINLYALLEPDKYDNNIKILKLNNKRM